MSEILKRLYNACNPVKPATPSQYVDSDEARGSRDLSRQFLRDLGNIEGDFLTFLFTGHLGCGKSSELHHLAENLRHPAQQDATAYFPIILDAEDFVDSYDAAPSDVLLSALASVAQELREIDIELQDSFVWRRLHGLKDLLLTEIEAPESVGVEMTFPLAKVTAKLPLLKSAPTNRKLVREALGNDTSSLKSEIQHQFEKARGELQGKRNKHGQPYRDFVLILDNLEKIDRVKGREDGYLSHRQFFIESASQLTGLGAHVIYTVPLPLVINDGPELAGCYGSWPFVLPMIKTEERPTDRTRYPSGWETLREMVEKRVGGALELSSAIDDDALELLIKYCGGHTRQLLASLRQSVTMTNGETIDLRAARQAVADAAGHYSRMPDSYWDKLAALELSPNQRINTADPDFKAMVQQLIVLEYRNGGAEESFLDSAPPWYSAHPIVRELEPFKRAVEELKVVKKCEEAARKRAEAAENA